MTTMPMIEPFLENPMSALVEYPDGRILTVGGISQVGPPDIYMARLMPYGGFDPSFGADGVRLHSIGAWSDHVSDMLLLPDGRFILAGSADDTALVSCYFANGDPDPSFGANGLVWLTLPESPSYARTMSRAQDGRVTVLLTSHHSIHLARILADGQLDASFSGDGLQLLHEVEEPYAQASMDVDSQGRVIVAWDQPDVGGHTHVEIERWLYNGDPDPSFGDGGQTQVDLTVYSDEVWDVLVRPNGRMLISGDTYTVDEESAFVAELDENGDFVPAFNGDGFFLFSLEAWGPAPGSPATDREQAHETLASRGVVMRLARLEGELHRAVAEDDCDFLVDGTRVRLTAAHVIGGPGTPLLQDSSGVPFADEGDRVSCGGGSAPRGPIHGGTSIFNAGRISVYRDEGGAQRRAATPTTRLHTKR